METCETFSSCADPTEVINSAFASTCANPAVPGNGGYGAYHPQEPFFGNRPYPYGTTVPFGLSILSNQCPRKEDYPDAISWRVASAIYYGTFGWQKCSMRMMDAQLSKSIYTRTEEVSKPEFTKNSRTKKDITSFGYHPYNPIFPYIERQVGKIATQRLRLKAHVVNESAKSRKAEHKKQTAMNLLMAELMPEMYEEFANMGSAPPKEGLDAAIAKYGGFDKFVNKGYRDMYADIGKSLADDWITRTRYLDWRPQLFRELALTNIIVSVPEVDRVTFEVNPNYKLNSTMQILDLNARGDYLENQQFYISFDYLSINDILRTYPQVDRDKLRMVAQWAATGYYSAPFGIPFVTQQNGIPYFLIIKARWKYVETVILDFEEESGETTATGDFIYVRPSAADAKEGKKGESSAVNIEGGELWVTIEKNAEGNEIATIKQKFGAPPHPPQEGEKDPAGERQIPNGDYIIPKYAVEKFEQMENFQRLEFLKRRLSQGQSDPRAIRREQIYYTTLLAYNNLDGAYTRSTDEKGEVSFMGKKIKKGTMDKDGRVTGQTETWDSSITEAPFDENRYTDPHQKAWVRTNQDDIRTQVNKLGDGQYMMYGYYELEGGILPNQARSVDKFAQADLGVVAYVVGNSVSSFFPTKIGRIKGLYMKLQLVLFKIDVMVAKMKGKILVAKHSIVPESADGTPDIDAFVSRIIDNDMILLDEDLMSALDNSMKVQDLVTTIELGLPDDMPVLLQLVQHYSMLIQEEMSDTPAQRGQISPYETKAVAEMNMQQGNLANAANERGFLNWEERHLTRVVNLEKEAMEMRKASALNTPSNKQAYETRLSSVGDSVELLYPDGASMQDYAIQIRYALDEAQEMQDIRQMAMVAVQQKAMKPYQYLLLTQCDEVEEAMEIWREFEEEQQQAEQERQMQLQQQQIQAQAQAQQEALLAQKEMQDSKLSGDLTKEKMRGDIAAQNSQNNAELQAQIGAQAEARKQLHELDLADTEAYHAQELEKIRAEKAKKNEKKK
jgi:hypothetical protein